MFELLDSIECPGDVKRLQPNQLKQLAEEIRSFLVSSVCETGGHLASNLGVVELTIALVYVYDFPQDKIVWDVGHQSYIYKILTGRKGRMQNLRTFDGLSGFPDRNESRYDCFNTGHASTSISAALGMARARELHNGNADIIAVIGDGALTGGLAWEALNDVGDSEIPLTIVLNDNDMSIEHNVGGLSRRMSVMRLSKGYAKFKLRVSKMTGKIPPLYRFLKKRRDNLKMRILHNEVFEQFGISYFGPVDGHDINELIRYFQLLKNYKTPALLHVLTKKGKGFQDAEEQPTQFHGLCPKSSTALPSFSKLAGHIVTELATENSQIVVVTAAMTQGTGFTEFEDRFRTRTFDVGIAEGHAVTMAAGLAAGGLKPYVAIYSTFLQRAYDQVLHDVCLMDLPVTFLLDRAGVSNGDGATHHGIYDVGYLSAMPHMTLYAPKDLSDLAKILEFSVTYYHPLAIRYPKDCEYRQAATDVSFAVGTWETLLNHDGQKTVIAYGDRMLQMCYDVCSRLGVGLINASWIRPMDYDLLNRLACLEKLIVVEDSVAECGLYSMICSYYADRKRPETIISLGLPNEHLKFGENEKVFESCGITALALTEKLK